MPRSSAIATVSLATTLMTAAAAQTVISARPGTVDYVEGQASLMTPTGGADLKTRMESTISLGPGESLKTATGRAEIQLTPGIFLRVGQNSKVKMVSPSLVHTVVAVEEGLAEIEVDQLFAQNDLRVTMGSGPAATQTQLVKPGVYEFDATTGVVRVFEGRAEISREENLAKSISVKSGHLLAVNGDSVKPQSFNKKKTTDDLVAWGDLRSEYVGEENASLVQSGGGSGIGNGFAGGLYDSGFGTYPWFPGAGFYSPYGLGLYSFYGGPFGFGYPGFGYAGFGYPGLGYGFFGGSGYGFGGLGYGGYGGYGYVGGGRPIGLGYRNGYSGQFGNRGTGRPGPVVGLHGATSSGGQTTSAGRASSAGSAQSAGGGFHGGGSTGGGASHASGGGSHR